MKMRLILMRRRCGIILLFFTFGMSAYFYDLLSYVKEMDHQGGDLSSHNSHSGHLSYNVKIVNISVVSSFEYVSFTLDGQTIFNTQGKKKNDKDRGIHVIVLNEATGSRMAHRWFDTYAGEDSELKSFLDNLSPGRLCLFAIQDEGSFNLGNLARHALATLGSHKIMNLRWRETWAMVTFKGGAMIGESHGPNMLSSEGAGPPTFLYTTARLQPTDHRCPWGSSPEISRRVEFCSLYEGYPEICRCDNPAAVAGLSKPILDNPISDVPVAVIAGNRPGYLQRGLHSLLSADGANVDKITVFIDGHFEEPAAVCKLYGVRSIEHKPVSERNARISQHYRASLTTTFNLYPLSRYMIIVEEDLYVSPDFFSYFAQTFELMDSDSSIYCVSAWNDQGYKHTSSDPQLLYRVETMPGLGWMLKRQLYKDELEPKWPSPEKFWDWDMWMRTSVMRKGRECIIPDISRTYHFGAKGTNMNPYFHKKYFEDKTINQQSGVVLRDVDRMTLNRYDELLRELVTTATILDHSKNPCDGSFFPKQKTSSPLILYVKMANQTDTETLSMLSKHDCLRLWDLGVRGLHKGVLRLFIHSNHLLIVGFPFSPFSRLKPKGVQPIYIKAPPPPPKKDKKTA